jgi:glycosyltransferase involved in cell wall biosynthesis
MVGWLPFALYAGIRLIRRHPVRAIVASGPPFTTVLLGWLLTLLTSRPLLVDMRDAWAEDESDPFGTIGGRFRAPYGKLRIRTLRRLEGTVIKAARGIFFTSTYTLRRYLERYPGAAPRSELVLNGVEESDFAREPPATNAFTFAYVGTLHDYQLPDVERFLAAFAHALTVDPSFGSARVFLAGHHGAALAKHLEALVSQYRLGDCVTIAGPIPHEEAIDVLKAAGTILLVAGANPFVRLTKIPEAAAAQRPVLVLAAPGSETARCATDLGQTVSSGQSIQELAGLLLRFRGAERPGVAGFPFPYPHPANWRAAAEQVARRLDTVTREAR